MKIGRIILVIALVGMLFSCEQKEKPQITFVVKRGTAIEVQLAANEPNTSVIIVNGKQDTTFRIGEQPTAIKYVPTATDTVTILGHITKFEYNGYMQEAMIALDVSKNTELTAISCPGNHLQTLDVSKNVALEQLDCEENHLTHLDVSKNIALKELKCSSIENDYEYCLTTLDVTNNTKLEVLFCMQHCLKELDVSKNTALKRLCCTENSLKNLDVSYNTDLTVLWCNMNDLSSLDVSNNKALKTLNCQYNQLKSLDVSGCPHLADSDDYYFNCKNNPDLRCIQISPTQYTKNADSWQKDATQSFNVNCGKGSIWGNSLKEQANSTKYEGTLGKNKITLELNLSSDFSLYMYNKYRTPILLKKQKSEKYLEFVEQFPQNGGNAYKNGGRLQLFFKGENKEQIQGKYTSPEGTKTYYVDLRVVKQLVTDLYKYFSEEELQQKMDRAMTIMEEEPIEEYWGYQLLYQKILKEDCFYISPDEVFPEWGKADKVATKKNDRYYDVYNIYTYPHFTLVLQQLGESSSEWLISSLETNTPGFGFGGIYVGLKSCDKAYLSELFKKIEIEKSKDNYGFEKWIVKIEEQSFTLVEIIFNHNNTVKSVKYSSENAVG